MQLNEANSADTEVAVLGLHLLISNGFLSSKIYDNAMILILTLLICHFLDGDVPRAPSYVAYISQFIRFAKVPSR